MEEKYSVITFSEGRLPETYKALVYSKWLRSLKFGNDYFKLIDSSSYYSVYHNYIEKILAKASVSLATLGDDNDVVLGFSVHRDGVLDYVHVQKDYRRKGIGRSLVPKNVVIVTHVTRNGSGFWHNVVPWAVFNPFI